ncbi:MAG: hypothetical protein RR291_06100 [Clostridia bacterium]
MPLEINVYFYISFGEVKAKLKIYLFDFIKIFDATLVTRDKILKIRGIINKNIALPMELKLSNDSKMYLSKSILIEEIDVCAQIQAQSAKDYLFIGALETTFSSINAIISTVLQCKCHCNAQVARQSDTKIYFRIQFCTSILRLFQDVIKHKGELNEQRQSN